MLTSSQIIALRMPGVTIDPGYLELAAAKVPACVPAGSQDYETAVALAAMHLYTLDQNAASGSMASGAVVSEKEGDLAIAYGDTAGYTGDYAATPWGVQLAALLEAYSYRLFTRYTDVC